MGLNAGNKKNPNKAKAVEERDIISQLPESIIGHILSFLPTDEAVRTSVLSTKWIKMWTFITSLHFSDSSCIDIGWNAKKRFTNFIEKVLHHTQPDLHSITLTCDRSYNYRSINKLVRLILRRQVQKLHIYYYEDIHEIPSNSLLNSNSLVHLQLETICTLAIPPSISLPNLQTLILNQISFQNNSSPDSEEVILSLPLLKVFRSLFCKWINVQCVSFVTPLLESFEITCFKFKFTPDKSMKFGIKISALHLKKFFVCGNLRDDIVLLESPSPVDASILICRGRTFPLDELFPRTCTLLHRFHEVEKLKLGHLTMMVLDDELDLLESLPTFEKLIYLEINLLNCDSDTVLNLLHKSPNLKTLVCQKAPTWVHPHDLTSSDVPYCFLFNLKTVEFKEYDWSVHDACFIRFVMATGQGLEQVKIHLTNRCMYYSEQQIDLIKETVQLFEKGSRRASVSVDVHSH